MATLKIIRKRISSVKNTQKITKAMKMVAAAKLRRAQTALYKARPYGRHLSRLLLKVSANVSRESHPFFNIPEQQQKSVNVVVISSDKGLCGGFNSNLLRKVHSYISLDLKHYSRVSLRVVGRKGRDFFRAKKVGIDQELAGLGEKPLYEDALKLAHEILESYLRGEFSSLYLAFNSFKSAISQEVQIRQILPLELSQTESVETLSQDVIFEPSPDEMFSALLPKALASEIYLAFLESQASELGARMSAMENATNNAKEMIGLLTLQYNRVRQAAITKELMDIVNGAESLK
ncbi:MAG: ATP synthase F1 subunit gamma [Deltaproteobacteria bacterium]|nr:ATP synthase F1 subunit gamma [Deltaproteobacteria bacterium]